MSLFNDTRHAARRLQKAQWFVSGAAFGVTVLLLVARFAT